MVKFLWGLLLIPALLMGCGKSNNTNTNVQEGKSGGNILVHVSDGDTISRPLYSWEDPINNDMSAMKIEVAQTSNLSSPVWGEQSNDPSKNNIQSPLTQGDPGSSLYAPFVTTDLDLQSNIEYRVTITKADGITSGYREFTIVP